MKNILSIQLAIFYFLLTGSVFAVSENDLGKIYFSEVVPLLNEKSKSDFFIGKENKKIHYFHYESANAKGVLVISPGQAEPALKYAELVYDLKDAGYDIFVIDHRGQGASERLLEDPVKSHVEKFQYYVDDLATFVKTIVHPENYPNSILLGHSMGGAIASGLSALHGKLFKHIVLSAPMIQIETNPYPEVLALGLAHVLSAAGKSISYAPKQKPYNPDEKFSDQNTTHSWLRFRLEQELWKIYPQLPLGGTTVNWVKTSLDWTLKIRKVKNVFRVPTTLFQATNDKWVKSRGQNQICAASPSVCKITVVQGSRHEILFESDEYRNLILTHLKSLL
tara:strand:- start:41605 stop:42612 length:1008 start_codon:yes stop_codon:yes gene_type:complete